MPSRVVPHCRDCRNCRVKRSHHGHYILASCAAGHSEHPVPLEEIEALGWHPWRHAATCPDWEE